MKVIDKKIEKVKTEFGFHPGKNYKGLESLELRKLIISKKQYLKFLKHYTFSALQGLPIGPAFCNYFDVDDFILLDSGNDNTYIKEYIEKIYVEPSVEKF